MVLFVPPVDNESNTKSITDRYINHNIIALLKAVTLHVVSAVQQSCGNGYVFLLNSENTQGSKMEEFTGQIPVLIYFLKQ